MMHCVVGFCFALTGLAGMELAKASRPRIESWYSQVRWGIIRVQLWRNTSGQQQQCYTGIQRILNVTWPQILTIIWNLLFETSHQARYKHIALNTQDSHQRQQREGSAASSEQFGAQHFAPGLLSSHGGHGRWKTRHSLVPRSQPEYNLQAASEISPPALRLFVIFSTSGADLSPGGR